MNHDALIVSAAARHGLDPNIVRGLVLVESGGYPYAFNPEPKYRWFWDVRRHAPFRVVSLLEVGSKTPPTDFPGLYGDPDQEWWLQQGSIGLMQVMGAVARELGFNAPSLLELVDPARNLDVGCLKLSQLKKWAEGDIEQALAAYNGGTANNFVRPFRNESYVRKVLARVALVKAGEI